MAGGIAVSPGREVHAKRIADSGERIVDTWILQMLPEAGRRAPWAVLGYSKELIAIWNKKNQEFCAAVEQRRSKPAT